jgi:hypothetical protein
MKVLSRYIHAVDRQQLLKKVLNLQDSLPTTASEKAHFITLLTSSQISRVYNVDLSNRFNNIPAINFRYFVAFHLNLPPPTVLLPRAEIGYDYPVSKCSYHKKINDINCNHIAGCDKCSFARDKVHFGINMTCAVFGGKAGYKPNYEPRLHEMLLHLYPANIIESIFPKHPTKQSNVSQNALAATINSLHSTLNPTQRAQLVKNAIAALPVFEKKDAGAIRPDVLLAPLNGKGEDIYIDGSAIHTSCDSYIKKQLKSLEARCKDDIALFKEDSRPSAFTENTPAVAAVAKKKFKKYGLIASLINLQVAAKHSTRGGRVIPAIVSHRGEIGGDLLNFIEQCTNRFKGLQARTFDINGLSIAQRTSDYRRDFKNSLMINLASNWGSMMSCGFAKSV